MSSATVAKTRAQKTILTKQMWKLKRNFFGIEAGQQVATLLNNTNARGVPKLIYKGHNSPSVYLGPYEIYEPPSDNISSKPTATNEDRYCCGVDEVSDCCDNYFSKLHFDGTFDPPSFLLPLGVRLPFLLPLSLIVFCNLSRNHLTSPWLHDNRPIQMILSTLLVRNRLRGLRGRLQPSRRWRRCRKCMFALSRREESIDIASSDSSEDMGQSMGAFRRRHGGS